MEKVRSPLTQEKSIIKQRNQETVYYKTARLGVPFACSFVLLLMSGPEHTAT
jgi:hypothetical protein